MNKKFIFERIATIVPPFTITEPIIEKVNKVSPRIIFLGIFLRVIKFERRNKIESAPRTVSTGKRVKKGSVAVSDEILNQWF